ncbi:MAG: NAD(P)-dependent oxidoreductase [Mogibacterium sp.]|nr:NAD(P)-dependent oxidoreductase [Mogibacterium sp.]
MKIAITGASGFVGRYLTDTLRHHDDVRTLALTRKELPANAGEDACEWAQTDYSKESLVGLFAGVDAVIHLAGNKGDKTELSDFDTDLLMMQNILDAMAETGVKRIVFASSRLVYGNPETVPWKEGYEPNPGMAYAVNKARCEKLCLEYADTYGFDAVIVRVAQVLGKGEGTRTMINVFQDLAKAGEPLTVIGRSVARRQYIYAKDLAEILALLAEREEGDSLIINAGMQNAYTNYELAEMMNRAYGSSAPINYDDSKPETITSSYMDVEVLTNKIGYTPMDMEQALYDMANS